MKEEKPSVARDAPIERPITPDYLTMSRLCHAFQKRTGSKDTIEDTMIVGYRLLDLRAKGLGTTDTAVSLIDAGMKPKVTGLFQAAKTRVDQRARAAAAKRKGGVEDTSDDEMTRGESATDLPAPCNKKKARLSNKNSRTQRQKFLLPIFWTRGTADASSLRGEPEGNCCFSHSLQGVIGNSQAGRSSCLVLLLVIGLEMSAQFND